VGRKTLTQSIKQVDRKLPTGLKETWNAADFCGGTSVINGLTENT